MELFFLPLFGPPKPWSCRSFKQKPLPWNAEIPSNPTLILRTVNLKTPPSSNGVVLRNEIYAKKNIDVGWFWECGTLAGQIAAWLVGVIG